MTLHQKVNGVWVECARPHVKENGIWVGALQAHIKEGGIWKKAYEQDTTPPNPPEILLSLFEDFDNVKGKSTLKTRYIKVGIRLPGGHDPRVKRVRVLTEYNDKPPTSKEGATFTQGSDDNYPNEPWSEWRYAPFGAHKDTSVIIYKQWRRNMAAGDTIEGQKHYYFTAWTEDVAENWSAGTDASIWVPRDGVETENIVKKEVRIQPNSSGSWRSNGFQSGKLVQQNSPRSNGIWFYGNQITNAVGQQGPPTIKTAQIYVRRLGGDSGAQTANVYLYWTDQGTPGAVGSELNKRGITKIGQLAKGEGNWFKIPDSYLDDLSKNVKSLGLNYKDPIKAEAQNNDFSTIEGIATAPRCGELHLVWEEKL